jgi:hypothetical protein
LNCRKANQHPRVTAIVVGYEESRGIHLHQDLPVKDACPQNEAFTALVKSSEQFPSYFQRGSAIRRAVLSSRQHMRCGADVIERYLSAAARSTLIAASHAHPSPNETKLTGPPPPAIAK